MNKIKTYDTNNYNANFFLDIMLNETDECIIFVDVEGKIDSLIYSDKSSTENVAKGILSRMFR